MTIFDSDLLDAAMSPFGLKKMLTLKEASEQYGISLSRLQKWSAKRKIPIVKIGRSVYIEPHTFENWLEQFFIPYHPEYF